MVKFKLITTLLLTMSVISLIVFACLAFFGDHGTYYYSHLGDYNFHINQPYAGPIYAEVNGTHIQMLPDSRNDNFSGQMVSFAGFVIFAVLAIVADADRYK